MCLEDRLRRPTTAPELNADTRTPECQSTARHTRRRAHLCHQAPNHRSRRRNRTRPINPLRTPTLTTPLLRLSRSLTNLPFACCPLAPPNALALLLGSQPATSFCDVVGRGRGSPGPKRSDESGTPCIETQQQSPNRHPSRAGSRPATPTRLKARHPNRHPQPKSSTSRISTNQQTK